MSKSPSSQPGFQSGLNQSFQGLALSGGSAGSPPSTPAAAPASPAGRLTIEYKELKFGNRLGAGTYGEVFEGEFRKNRVAIKVYKLNGQLESAQQAAILQEATLMEGLHSDFLVGLRGICWDPRYCLVMEYCEGGTLRARLNKNKDIPLPDKMRWAQQISYGLHNLHSIKIVHRDLKGENILLDKHGDAKVADFGLSIVKTSTMNQSKLGGGIIAGTLPWIAPEIFAIKPKYSSASDVYSLAMVLWEIVSGQIPFKEADSRVLPALVLGGQREEINSQWPPIFKTFIQACWDADPAKRPIAEKVGDEFKAALDSLEAAPKPVSKSAAELEVEKLREQLRQAELKNQQLQQQAVVSVIPAKAGTYTPVISPRLPPLPPLSKLTTIPLNLPAAPIPQSSVSSMPVPTPDVKSTPVVDVKALGKLLQLVAEGEQDQAEILIQQNKQLLLASGQVTDLSGRTFQNITGFQYALWAMDYHMWTMIKKYLPAEAQAQQFNGLETKGTEHGKHYDTKPLMNALQTYVDNALKWDYDQRAVDQWCKGVGGAQKLVPAHVVNEYARTDRCFWPCPTEWDSKLPRTREVEFYNGSQSVRGSWFICPSSQWVLGTTFAFYRQDNKLSRAKERLEDVIVNDWRGYFNLGGGASTVNADFTALKSLWKARTQQLESLGSELQSVAVISQPPQLVPVSVSQNPQSLMPAPIPAVDAKALGKLLQLVAEGEQDQAEAMIQQNKQLLLVSGQVTDLSGRTFQSITAFQYALWAMDWHMWMMIRKYLPKEAQTQQLQMLETKGTEHDKHYDIKPLTDALQKYEDNYKRWDNSQCIEHWCKIVGGTQKLVPTHIVNEYVRPDRPFEPCPTEWESKLLRNRGVDVVIGFQRVKGSWFIAPSSKDSLGSTFAFYRYNTREGAVYMCDGDVLRDRAKSEELGRWNPVWLRADLKALQCLWKARTQQLEALKSELLSAAPAQEMQSLSLS